MVGFPKKRIRVRYPNFRKPPCESIQRGEKASGIQGGRSLGPEVARNQYDPKTFRVQGLGFRVKVKTLNPNGPPTRGGCDKRFEAPQIQPQTLKSAQLFTLGAHPQALPMNLSLGFRV